MAKKKVIRTQVDFSNQADSSLWREELIHYLSPEDWHEVGAQGEPAFENSWVNYDTATPYTSAAFYKSMGRVYIKGAIKSGTLNTTAFTLPAQYRPSAISTFPNIQTSAAEGSYVQILSDGSVNCYGTSNTFYGLDGISFRVD